MNIEDVEKATETLEKSEPLPECPLCGPHVYHADPCQFVAGEQHMTQTIKTIFRERQAARLESLRESAKRESQLQALAKIENDRNGHYMTPSQEREYIGLTGHDFKEE